MCVYIYIYIIYTPDNGAIIILRIIFVIVMRMVTISVNIIVATIIIGATYYTPEIPLPNVSYPFQPCHTPSINISKPEIPLPTVYIAINTRKQIIVATIIIGATYYTPEIIRVKSHWKTPLQIHRTIPVKVHWASDSHLDITAKTRNPVD